MSGKDITIIQAQDDDIIIVENILLDAVNWLNEMGQPLWGENEVRWDALSINYRIDDFFVAYIDGNPAGCMALVDYDPFFWPDVKRGESMFIHKLAVTKAARKSGAADALMDFFKRQGAERGVKTLRLDTHALRPKLRAFYERHGFVHVGTKIYKNGFHTAFYIYEVQDMHGVEINRLEPDFRQEIIDYVNKEWGIPIVTRGNVIDITDLPGFIAVDNGKPVGAALYQILNSECEIVVLYSLVGSKGIGSKLIGAIINAAKEQNYARVWLITTNDNTPAMRYYQKRGFSLKAVHVDAFLFTQKLKGEFGTYGGGKDGLILGIDDIPIRHEVELEIAL